MGVHFVYRSGYENPLGHRLVSFEDRDMLAWFQRNWLSMRDVPSGAVEWFLNIIGAKELEIDYDFLEGRTEASLGGFVYGFEAVWTSMTQNPPPKTNEELVAWLNSIEYPEGVLLARHNAFQASTNDDERDLVLMMFDDSFAQSNPERVALFLHNELDLPTNTAPSGGSLNWSGKSQLMNSSERSSQSTYCIFIVLEDTAWLSPPKGVFEFANVDLTSLAEELRKPVEFNHEQWPSELRMFRSIVVRQLELSTREALELFVDSEPFDNASLFDAWESGKCVEERFLGNDKKVAFEYSEIAERLQQRIRPANPNHSRQFSDNFVRIGFHAQDAENFRDSYHLAMYFFDDLWAQANPVLATSLLHYGSKGMCLFD